jgi:hypothetical protein
MFFFTLVVGVAYIYAPAGLICGKEVSGGNCFNAAADGRDGRSFGY